MRNQVPPPDGWSVNGLLEFARARLGLDLSGLPNSAVSVLRERIGFGIATHSFDQVLGIFRKYPRARVLVGGSTWTPATGAALPVTEAQLHIGGHNPRRVELTDDLGRRADELVSMLKRGVTDWQETGGIRWRVAPREFAVKHPSRLRSKSRPIVGECDSVDKPAGWVWTGSDTSLHESGEDSTERTAIQTGLRSSELRSLTRKMLFLDSQRPYVTCKAANTKNAEFAKQYIQPELAAELSTIVARKAFSAQVFKMPHVSNVAGMLHRDVKAAHKAWLKAAKDNPDERLRREQSDFLAVVNHEGERLDFHSLRHSCGVWLAMAGSHPKTIQAVMRHSTITLTMDTYGHLVPGQVEDAIDRVREMLQPPTSLKATGTDDAATRSADEAQRQAHRTGREKWRLDTGGCESHQVNAPDRLSEEAPERPRENADGGEILPVDASPDEEIGPLGFEPRLTDSESVVLPLH